MNSTFASRAGKAVFKAENKAVEQAEPKTPGDDLTCETCGFEAKTPAGLVAHQRRHDG